MISNVERDLCSKYNHLYTKDEMLKLHFLLDIIQTIGYNVRELWLSVLVKGRQRQMKFIW
jgi:hypothetical protein